LSATANSLSTYCRTSTGEHIVVIVAYQEQKIAIEEDIASSVFRRIGE